MSYYKATIMFVVGLISFAVLLPVATTILPFITNTMGGTVTTMVGAMMVVIIVTGIFLYYKLSTTNDEYLPPGAYDYESINI